MRTGLAGAKKYINEKVSEYIDQLEGDVTKIEAAFNSNDTAKIVEALNSGADDIQGGAIKMGGVMRLAILAIVQYPKELRSLANEIEEHRKGRDDVPIQMVNMDTELIKDTNQPMVD